MTKIYQHFIIKSHTFNIKPIVMVMLMTLSTSYVDASVPNTVAGDATPNRATFNSAMLDTVPVITMHD